jgi:hypothetical protein
MELFCQSSHGQTGVIKLSLAAVVLAMIVQSLSIGKPTMVLRVIGCARTAIVVPVTLLFNCKLKKNNTKKTRRQHFSLAPRKLRTGQIAVVYHLVFSQKTFENETRDNGYFSVVKDQPQFNSSSVKLKIFSQI